jgi:demethylmenaquinone methyltransferase/2-methoxy-6-polyprenyl-1,4-benzoquinol methylase
VTPFIGGLVSRDSSAYSYLPKSVYAFPDGNEFIAVLKQCGFSSSSLYSLTFNIASIYVARK